MRDFLIKLVVCAALITGVMALAAALPTSASNLRLNQFAAFE
ncbi:MAG TPA: hypothetical protein VGM87_17975 [Roseomonas sp.]|jgi:hypothetical protein